MFVHTAQRQESAITVSQPGVPHTGILALPYATQVWTRHLALSLLSRDSLAYIARLSCGWQEAGFGASSVALVATCIYSIITGALIATH